MTPIRKKQLRFYNKVMVYLIPTRYECDPDLWYESSDYSYFRVAYIEQIKTIMQRHVTDSRTARDILNKTGIVYDDSYF